MLRFGCLGAARITPQALIAPAALREDVMVSAIAARAASRARAFADEYEIGGTETDYAALIARGDVDAVYNALAPDRHMDLTCLALAAGKPVLCEKPFAMNADEARKMAEQAKMRDTFLMEAFHYRFHPAFQQVVEIVRGGDLGRIQSYEGVFSVEIPERDGELRHELALGGGALMDLGCYPLHWARSLLDGVPEILSAKAETGRPGIDLSMRAELLFDGGVRAKLKTSMAPGAPRRAALEIVGTAAALKVTNPLAPHMGYRIEILPNGGGDPIRVADAPAGGLSTYDYQLAHFMDCLAGKTEPLLGLDDAVANMAAIDAIYTAAGLQPRGLGDGSQ